MIKYLSAGTRGDTLTVTKYFNDLFRKPQFFVIIHLINESKRELLI